MELKIIEVGKLYTNCYVCYEKETGEAVIIDPGEEADKIIAFIERSGLKPVAIMLTHSHFDHLCAVQELKEKYMLPVAAYEGEKRLLENKDGVLARPFMKRPVQVTPDILLKDNEKYCPFSSGAGFLVLHTPGHTEGGASYWIAEMGAVFTGDTLFRMSVGRSDFPTGNHERLIASIKERLFPLGDETIVYPGHGERTKIKDERLGNPFLADK